MSVHRLKCACGAFFLSGAFQRSPLADTQESNIVADTQESNIATFIRVLVVASVIIIDDIEFSIFIHLGVLKHKTTPAVGSWRYSQASISRGFLHADGRKRD